MTTYFSHLTYSFDSSKKPETLYAYPSDRPTVSVAAYITGSGDLVIDETAFKDSSECEEYFEAMIQDVLDYVEDAEDFQALGEGDRIECRDGALKMLGGIWVEE